MPKDDVIPANTFVRTEQLCRDATALAGRLVHADAIVGVARSGLIPAATIAAHLQRPLWTVSESRGVASAGHGSRMRGDRSLPNRVVIVDDTAHSGAAMRTATDRVRKYFPKSQIERAVVYCHPQSRGSVDHVHAVYGGPHYLEWNLFNGPNAVGIALDFDGILCHDPARDEDDGDDGPRYAAFLRSARPLYVARRAPVAAIITARPESARAATVDWLARYGVRFESLVMRSFPRPPAGGRWPAEIAKWKANALLESGQTLFAESCPALAPAIARLSGLRVVCPVAGTVYGPHGEPS